MDSISLKDREEGKAFREQCPFGLLRELGLLTFMKE
jgi:hypothetical protein